MAYRGKRRLARRLVMMTGRGESISSAGDSGENPYADPYALLLSACGRGFDAYGQYG